LGFDSLTTPIRIRVRVRVKVTFDSLTTPSGGCMRIDDECPDLRVEG